MYWTSGGPVREETIHGTSEGGVFAMAESPEGETYLQAFCPPVFKETNENGRIRRWNRSI
jgi:hypothetical protein